MAQSCLTDFYVKRKKSSNFASNKRIKGLSDTVETPRISKLTYPKKSRCDPCKWTLPDEQQKSKIKEDQNADDDAICHSKNRTEFGNLFTTPKDRNSKLLSFHSKKQNTNNELLQTPTSTTNNNDDVRKPSRSARKRLLLSDDCRKEELGVSPTKLLKEDDNVKKLTPDKMRTELGKCNKLADVQKLLIATHNSSPKKLHKTNDLLSPSTITVNQNSAITRDTSEKCELYSTKARRRLNSLRESLSKISVRTTTLREVCNTDEGSKKTPFHLKDRNSKDGSLSSLYLPNHYKVLAEAFRFTDTVVSLLHNRKEICTFPKLKISVQEMTKRNFNKTHLGQMKTVFPLAYIFHQEKEINLLSCGVSNNISEYQLTVTPNFNYENSGDVESADACRFKDDCTLNTSTKEINTPQQKAFKIMNATCLIKRQHIFKKRLLEIVKKHHEAFLASLELPLSIPHNQLTHWHPQFYINKIPNIQAASLPEPPIKEFTTAKNLLNVIKNDTIRQAIQSVADKHEELPSSVTTENPKTDDDNTVQNGALKGISQSLLDRIRAKQAAHIQMQMTRKPDEERRLEMLSRLPEMINILRNYFISEHKSVLSIDNVAQKLSESYHTPISSEDVQRHLRLLAEVVPEWISIVTVRKGSYVKIDKTKDLTVTIEKINQMIKQKNG